MIVPLDPKQPPPDNGTHGPGDWHAQQSLARALNGMQDYAIFQLDPQGRIQTWSSGAQALSGFSAEEIVGSSLSRLRPPEAGERSLARDLQSAAATGRFTSEGWYLRKDGTRRWVEASIAPLRAESGALRGFIDISRDLTERKRREDELRESEERFRLLVDGVRDYAIFTLDPAGRVTSWNSGARHIKGYEPQEIIGSHFSRFYPPDVVERGWPDHELRVAAREGRFEDEGWRVRKDGTRFWANVVITALRDAGGQLRGFSKITRDLSERRRQEETLRRSEERFRLIAEGVRDSAICLLDAQGIVSSWNAGAERIEGYHADEILGRHFSNLYRAEDVAESRPWRQLITARESGRVELEGWRVRKDGSSYWAKIMITSLHDAQGDLYGYAHVTQDMTQMRRTEALENVTSRMNEFIAILAHELRNPLAPIRNAVSLMERKGLGDPVLESMRQAIDRQSRHLERIVGELLDVSRIARGELVLDRRPIDLSEVVSRAVEVCRPAIEQREHELHVSLPSGPLPVLGDLLRLTQVLVNLLNNAAKYMRPGGHISLGIVRKNGETEIRVRDAGVGIRPEMLTRVFELFVQDRDTLDQANGGLGVGLALVRRVVEMHDGHVEAHSAGRDLGSEFVVYLPTLLAPTPEPRPEEEEAPPPRRWRVVIADDNVDAAQTLEVLLRSMDQETRVAYDGFAAVEAVEQFHPDIVMLDIVMPGLDGYEAARRIRALPGGSGRVLVAITGWGQEADKQRAREAGFDHHFVKPVSEAALKKLLSASAATPAPGT
ncbi:MAG: PAS domain S-box protein [Steroidobacteraceae bacterium]